MIAATGGGAVLCLFAGAVVGCREHVAEPETRASSTDVADGLSTDLRSAMRERPALGTLIGVDLFKAARSYPYTLRGAARVLTTEQIVRAGTTPTAIRWHVRGARLVHVHRGRYLVGVTTPDLLDRVRAALRVCPPAAAVGFHTAAALQGFGVPDDGDIHLVVPAGSPVAHRPGLRVYESVVPFKAVVTLGVPCTPPARTAVDLARVLDRPTALAVLDAALYAGACQLSDLIAELSHHATLRGIRQARELVPLADGRAECKQESHLRLILHDGGLVSFEPQVEVYDPESASPFPRFRLDLADRKQLVGAEYDGESHTQGRLRDDRRRHNRLSDLGWRMRYFTRDELYRAPEGIVPTLRRAIHDRR
jgi:hypothetical protein